MRSTLFVASICLLSGGQAFQPLHSSGLATLQTPLAASKVPLQDGTSHATFQPQGVLDENSSAIRNNDGVVPKVAAVMTIALVGTPTPALAAAGPVPSAFFAWLHFVGILGVSGGLIAERFLIRPGLTLEDENRINLADLIYGLSALSLLVSGSLRVTQYAKGWDFYKNEPIFWVKMSAVAILGALSFFPAIVFFWRDEARKKGQTMPPLSDALIERMTRIMNAEILALISIPLLASLMARGVLYVEDFPWPLGAAVYLACLGGAGYKYVTEAFQMMEEEGALVPVEDGSGELEQ